MSFQGYSQQVSAMHGIQTNQTLSVPGHGATAGRQSIDYFQADHGLGNDSSFAAPLYPEYVVSQSPSMASNAVYDDISTLPEATLVYPPTDVKTSGQGFVALDAQNSLCVDPTEITQTQSFHYNGRNMVPLKHSDGGFSHALGPADIGSNVIYHGRAVGADLSSDTHEFPQNLAYPPANGTTVPILDHRLGEPAGRGLVREKEPPCLGSRAMTAPLRDDGPTQISRTPSEGTIRFSRLCHSFRNEGNADKFSQLFPCLFHAAGCVSGFPGKNEWKRHINTIHIVEEAWICAEGSCATQVIVSHQQTTPGERPFPCRGRVFNRKDLYISHVGRTHVYLLPEKPKANRKLPSPEQERVATNACHRRVKLPTEKTCSHEGCSESFRGSMAWDSFLEHVADHLKRSSEIPGSPNPLSLQQPWDDAPLMRWGVKAGFLREAGDCQLRLQEAVSNPKSSWRKESGKRRYDEELDLSLQTQMTAVSSMRDTSG
ncbi:hypothetical protein HIM_10414 [Hirsutella minnesotensis 3608]|uniref:C2H2-type domain-containing protein n=1 Tax=Hirsutella minnesotensis 3608 TaxID=1043627 RepID=A0A0F7ZG33_9HYPO|nr:hypothetical protein HIM_10414 [Hirsutella minnesotensis 3608]